jgi:hypothetical protein
MFLVGKCDVTLIAIITIGETKKRKEKKVLQSYIFGVELGDMLQRLVDNF